jgi:hypothetical protein
VDEWKGPGGGAAAKCGIAVERGRQCSSRTSTSRSARGRDPHRFCAGSKGAAFLFVPRSAVELGSPRWRARRVVVCTCGSSGCCCRRRELDGRAGVVCGWW